jgi:hypothetical protein
VDLVLPCVLSSLSTLLQGIIDVESFTGSPIPVSVNILIIAESGERKSAVAKLLEQPIIFLQVWLMEKYKNEIATFKAEKVVVREKINYLKKLLRVAIEENDDKHIETLKVEILTLTNSNNSHYLSRIIMEDYTLEALSEQLEKGWGNITISSSEGSTVFQGRGLNSLALLNKIWSGEHYTVTRKSGDSFILMNRRASQFYMIQPSPFENFLDKKGKEAIELGYFARFIVAYPGSTQGRRFETTKNVNDDTGYEEYLEISERIVNIAKTYIENPNLERQVVRFSHQAKLYLGVMHDSIEKELDTNGRFHNAKEYGSKLTEITIRVAALLTYLELGEGAEISKNILISAEMLTSHFADTYIECFGKTPDYLTNARALIDFFQAVREDGVIYIKKNSVRRSGPPCCRDKDVLNRALNVLMDDGYLSTITFPSGLVVLNLLPSHAFNQLEWSEFCARELNNSPQYLYATFNTLDENRQTAGQTHIASLPNTNYWST